MPSTIFVQPSLPDIALKLGIWRNSRVNAMKVRTSVKRICRNCKIVRRKGVVRVICTDLRHKQRQG